MRVALVVMPFASPDRPSLAAGLLQASLHRRDIACDTKYFNITFWQMLGAETYRQLNGQGNMTPLSGEWIFSQAFYGEAFSDWSSYREEVLDDPLWGMPEGAWPAIRRARDLAPAFLRLVLESNDWSRYDLVGFTSLFEQTMASLALARAIKQAHPHIQIALGGANFQSGMGRPYIEHYDFIDFVATAEADDTFGELCASLDAVHAGRAEHVDVPPGFLYRDGDAVRESSGAAPFRKLDDVPTPDYDDYFRIAAKVDRGGPSTPGEPSQPWIMLEASRGCWWGQKAHCVFCGLNGATMEFRRKDWRRVATEVEELRHRYGDHPLQFADNILGMSYFDDLLPHWAATDPRPAKFFEIKSNLFRRQVLQLRDAGVTSVQAGVESLADDSLKLMNKGVSGAQNVALLRWCVEAGVEPLWNVLYGFPHEAPEDYDRNLDILRRLTHLPPPSGFGPIRLDRFSPNFAQWREQGFTAIEPMPSYRHLFPFDTETLMRLAYYFRYDHPRLDRIAAEGQRFGGLLWDWQDRAERQAAGELAVRPHWQGGFVLVDSRFNFDHQPRRLSDLETATVLACDAPSSRRRVLGRLAAAFPSANGTAEATLDRLVDESVIGEIGKRLIALPLLSDADIFADSTHWSSPNLAETFGRAD
ncbi:MAG: RiPP maturation radical SAM C-methyltransferase [Acidobacteriota bacterium]